MKAPLKTLPDILICGAGVFFPCVMLLAIFDQWPYLTETFSRGQILGRDAYNLWLAGHLALEGRIAEIYDHVAFADVVRELLGPEAGLHVFPYPPPTLLYLAVFGGLPYFLTLTLWSFLGAAAFLWAVAFPQWQRRDLLLALLAPMTLTNIVLGQNGLLTAALFIGGLRLAAHSPILAGILIGAMAYKPFLALLMPLVLLVQHRWITIMSATVTLLTLCLLPALIWGWEVWSLYLSQAVPFQRDFLEYGTGVGQTMKPSAFMGMRILGAEIAVSYLVQATVSAVTLMFVTGWLWRHRHNAGLSQGRIIAIVAVATILMLPYVHHYDLAIISAGLILLARDEGDARVSARGMVILGLLWGLPILCLMLNLVGMPLSAPIMLMALVWLMVTTPAPLTFPAASTADV